MSLRRQEQSLREFKEIVEDLSLLLAKSVGAHTVYMNWVNRERRQFVLESSYSTLPDVMFRDRVTIDRYFLSSWMDLGDHVRLTVPDDVAPDRLSHHYGEVPVRELIVIPFVNRSETVALTVLESDRSFDSGQVETAVSTYRRALGNLLNTWLELTELHEQEKQWPDYEERLEEITTRLHRMEVLSRMLDQIQALLQDGGASLIARGMGSWVNVLNSSGSALSPELGRTIDENSMVYRCLESGHPEFAVHFNETPKRLSIDEGQTEGATLAIPILTEDRRQGAVLIYSPNPLHFNEAVRHKMANLVRVASLAMHPGLDQLEPEQGLLVTKYESFIPDLWEKSAEYANRNAHPLRTVWFGLLTFADLPALRSRFRLEELKQLQRELVMLLNPARYGGCGFIGFHSDYIFSFLLQDSDPSAIRDWLRQVFDELALNGVMAGAERVELELRAGGVVLDGYGRDAYDSIQTAKSALDRAVRQDRLLVLHGEESD